jgi:hypothetical protein
MKRALGLLLAASTLLGLATLAVLVIRRATSGLDDAERADLERRWEAVTAAGGPLDRATGPALAELLEASAGEDDADQGLALAELLQAQPDLALGLDVRITQYHGLASAALESGRLESGPATALLRHARRGLERGTLVVVMSSVALLRTAHELAMDQPALAAALDSVLSPSNPLADDLLFCALCRDAVALVDSLTLEGGALTVPLGQGQVEMDDLDFLQDALRIAVLRDLERLEPQRTAPDAWNLQQAPEEPSTLAVWWAKSCRDAEGVADLMGRLLQPPLTSAVRAWSGLLEAQAARG